MFKFFDKNVDRIGYWYGTFALFVGPVTVGAVSGWLSNGVDEISKYGWFGWWMASLTGAALTALVLGFASWARYNWVYSQAQKKWSDKVDQFNPLEKDFRTKRILLSELAHPLTKTISGKRLYDCELIGPANMFASRNVSMNKVNFWGCTVIVLWPDEGGNVFPGNAVVLEDIEMHGGAIYDATILISPDLVPVFDGMGVKFASLTGNPEIDN